MACSKRETRPTRARERGCLREGSAPHARSLEPRLDQLEVAVSDAARARRLGDVAVVAREDALDVATLELGHDALARGRERQVLFDDGAQEVEALLLRLVGAVRRT